MIELIVILGVVLLFLCYLDWRLGMLIIIAVGFGQDIVRKLLPGEPVYMTVAVGIFFLATFVGAIRQGLPASLGPIFRNYPELKIPLTLFCLLVMIQIGVTLTKTGSLFLGGIGAIAYLSPIAAMVLVFWYGLRKEQVIGLIKFYIFICSAMCLGLYMEVWGFEWEILGSVGEGVIIYPSTGGWLILPSGFFRAAENAAWHGAAAIAFLVILVVSKEWKQSTWVAVVLGLFILGAVLLTGRRKAIMELVIFVCVYTSLLIYTEKGAGKLASLIGIGGVVVALIQPILLPEEDQATYKPYVVRTDTLIEESAGRLKMMAVDSVVWSINRNGYFGAGAGMGGQGAQHFGGGSKLVGGGAEGGLGKIVAELGVMGLALTIWIFISGIRIIKRILFQLKKETIVTSDLIEGYTAFLVANLIVFTTASQIFGDPFVLLVLGFVGSFILSTPIAVRDQQKIPSISINGHLIN